MTVLSSALSTFVRVPRVETLPEGSIVELPGRGSTYVTDVPGPAGAPTVVLLHALVTTGTLSWYPFLADLATHYRVVAFDQRWHGRGIRSPQFRLGDCADDVPALLDVLGIDRCIPVGYSMGSAVAQLLWRRNPSRVQGLTLCAATRTFRVARREKVFFPLLSAAALPLEAYAKARVDRFAAALPALPSRDGTDPEWGQHEFRSTSAWSLPEVLAEIGRFDSRPWVSSIDVPTSVVISAKDHTIPVRRQHELAADIPGAEVFEFAAGHGGIVLSADAFRPALLDAVASVVLRSTPAAA